MSSITLVVIYIILIYFGIYRNTKVLRFREDLTTKGGSACHAYLDSIPPEEYTDDNHGTFEHYLSIWQSIMDIPYEKMVFSFKPLKEEYWLTEEQIEFIHLYENEC